MTTPTLFTRIIRGELPSHKIYEDDDTYAFLSIYPSRPGHTLVVPKLEVTYLHQMPDDAYEALMRAVKKVMVRQAEVFGPEYKICVKVAGFDVPHVHVHIIPCMDSSDFNAREDPNGIPDQDALAAMAKRLAS